MGDVSTTPAATANKVAAVTLSFWIMKICATTVGETGGDLLSMTLNVGYAASSLILVGIFAITLIAQLRAKSFHPALYWAVILSTSTAGATLSDYMDRSLGLGYPTSNLLISSGIALTALGWRFTHISHTALFWAAFVLTRPFGATMGDLLTKPPVKGGLGFGTVGSTLVLLAILVALVALTAWRRRPPQGARHV